MNDSEDVRNLKLTLGVYALIFVLKLVVYFLSGVIALFAEALHTLSDMFVSGFLLAAALYSRKKADEMHMFGHGRAQYIGALVAATLFISFTSFELYREAIPRLFRSEPGEYENLALVVAVLLVSMLVAAAPLVRLYTQKERGAASKAQLTELVNDQLGLLAALLGTLLIHWGYPQADPLAAILVASIIAYNAVGLFRENASYLLGRSPGEGYLDRLRRAALSVPGVLGVHDLRAETAGPGIVQANLHILVAPDLTVEAAELIAEEVQRRAHQGEPGSFCTVHVDPAPREETRGEQIAPGMHGSQDDLNQPGGSPPAPPSRDWMDV